MSTRAVLRIATRASRLALWQSEHVAAALRARHPGLEVELLPVSTAGDRIIDQPLSRIGGKGLFIKELEVAIHEGRADIAVHSMKDVPAELPQEFEITSILEREDARDVLVSTTGVTLAALAAGSHVGTSSLRRRSQLLAARPDLRVSDLRGNVPTRLGRLERGEFDAIILAAAGLRRLGLMDARCHALAPETMLPAVGQGAIGIESRCEDDSIRALLQPLNCARSSMLVSAERAMNSLLGGNCQVPIAGYAAISGDTLTLAGLVAAVDGSRVVRQTASGRVAAAIEIGREVGHGLLNQGADQILASAQETREL